MEWIVLIPIIMLIIVFSALNNSTRKSRIEKLREKTKSLPLDEKALKERLEMFDKINSSVKEYEVKIKLLKRVASGEKVDLKKLKKKRITWEPYDFSEKSMGERTIDDMLLGILPSSITHRTQSFQAGPYSDKLG